MHSITINGQPLPRPPDVANLLSTPNRCTIITTITLNKLWHITHARHTPSQHDGDRAAKCPTFAIFHFFMCMYRHLAILVAS